MLLTPLYYSARTVEPDVDNVELSVNKVLMMLSFLLGLATMAGQCQAGYYCAGQADRQDPTDGTTGNICPPGRYCGQLLGNFC